MKMKVESNVRLDERTENAKEEFDKKVVTVGQVHSQAMKASEACEAMRQENRELRNQISKEIAEALKRKRDEEEFEHRRKQELIRQIRELEKIPIVRRSATANSKFVCPSYSFLITLSGIAF